jgi:hypothetical protein
MVAADAEMLILAGRFGFTVTVVADELAVEQLPLWTTALNWVVCVNTPAVYVAEVFAISIHVLKGETELCHLMIVPVYPDNVSKPLVFPEQMVVPPETLPPTDIGATMSVAAFELLSATYGLGLTLLVLDSEAFLMI